MTFGITHATRPFTMRSQIIDEVINVFIPLAHRLMGFGVLWGLNELINPLKEGSYNDFNRITEIELLLCRPFDIIRGAN